MRRGDKVKMLQTALVHLCQRGNVIVIVAALLLLVAAGDARAEDDRTVASVAGIQIGVDQLGSYVAARSPAAYAGSTEALRNRLEELVMTEALYREALRLGVDRTPEVARTIRQVVVQRLVEDQVERPARTRPITEDELKAYYERQRAEYDRPETVRLAEIFLAAPVEGGPGAREKRKADAEIVLAKARALQDLRFGFGELVLKHSDTPAEHPRGDTGFFDREGKPGGIEQTLASAGFTIAKVGQIHDGVVATPAGFHIVMLVARRAPERRAFEEVKGEIEQRIRREDRGRAMKDYLSGVRKSAEVSIDEAVLADLAKQYVPPPEGPGVSGAPPSLPGGAP